MAQLNLKQIADRLNAEFTQDTRKLVFWYDEKGEFADDINESELANAKVYKLTQGNQFYTKSKRFYADRASLLSVDLGFEYRQSVKISVNQADIY